MLIIPNLFVFYVLTILMLASWKTFWTLRMKSKAQSDEKLCSYNKKNRTSTSTSPWKKGQMEEHHSFGLFIMEKVEPFCQRCHPVTWLSFKIKKMLFGIILAETKLKKKQYNAIGEWYGPQAEEAEPVNLYSTLLSHWVHTVLAYIQCMHTTSLLFQVLKNFCLICETNFH